MKSLTLLLMAGLAYHCTSAQIPFGLVDARQNQTYCGKCNALIQTKPREVLFGIQVLPNGEVYFSMDNKDWFDQFFSSPSSGMTVDLISKDRYECGNPVSTSDLIHGTLLPPIHRVDWTDKIIELQANRVTIKIGKVPADLARKELEGNLVILNGNQICYYTNFVDIDRTEWALLPMGLYTDSLVKIVRDTSGKTNGLFTYSKKLQVIIPFDKNKTTYNPNDLRPIYDSLQLKDYIIRKIDIRAYASVEGPEKTNLQLMKGRAESMVNAFKKYQPQKSRISITTAENWVEFFQDIKKSPYADLALQSKFQIKQQLLAMTPGMDSILSHHRKAIVTVYLERRTNFSDKSNDSIAVAFQQAVVQRNVEKARMIQREIVERIIDNQLPSTYMNRLEVPMEKIYAPLLNDRVVYDLFLQNTFEYDALQQLREIKKLDPLNGRINYNIAALELTLWQYNVDAADFNSLQTLINDLSSQGIEKSLVKRLLINYHILRSEDYLRKNDYPSKDQSVAFIHTQYKDLALTDEEIFSLAKYLFFYSEYEWSEEIVEPRVDKIDVSEDIVFYYVNLGFYHPDWFSNPKYQNAILNAVNLNRQRFCKFFNSIYKGGASMQLLEHPELRKYYCESCTLRSEMMTGFVVPGIK